MYLLKNKQVLITGGGGKLGLELALNFGKNGAKIILLDTDQEKLAKANELLSSFDIHTRTFEADVLNENRLSQLADDLSNSSKPVDLLVNAACLGVLTHQDFVMQDVWKKEAETVLKGSRNTIKYFGRYMEKGSVVNIVPFPERATASGATLYSSLKTGIHALTTVWARELGATGTRVNTIVPGFFEEFEMASGQSVENLKEKIPLKRLGNFAEMAGLLTFLATSQAAYITGASIPLDGGYTC